MYASRPTFLVILNRHRDTHKRSQQQQQVATRGVDINELKGKGEGVSYLKVVDNYATEKITSQNKGSTDSKVFPMIGRNYTS